MFEKSEYALRGYNYLHNKIFPHKKRLSSLMLYTTDLCDSGCKHCLIWAKRPPVYLSFDAIRQIMKSDCIHASTMVGLEGGEFLLHPEADAILAWFAENHPNYDIFSNCLKPDRLIAAVQKYKPHRLYISLDGDEETYLYMRGKDGYKNVLQVITELKKSVPIFVMFTLSPYNDFSDLEHVAALCKEHGVFLRVGIYNNIPFFDTIEEAKKVVFGQSKNKELLNFREAKQLQHQKSNDGHEGSRGTEPASDNKEQADYHAGIPAAIKEFDENYDYISLYPNWVNGNLKMKCNSIMDSVIVLPNGTVPICQNLDIKLGNVHENTLDIIFNSAQSVKTQQYHAENCNQCWVSYHRKYDIALYRNFEKFFGKHATSKLLGYYKWDSDEKLTYKEAVR
ncbi:MAG: radical SAM protein [Chitinophagaceae bacterium]